MRVVYYVFLLLVIVIVASFAFLNASLVNLNYLIGNTELSLALLLACTLVLGILVGIVTLLPSLIRSKHAKRKLNARIRQIEQEVKNLRSIPINDSH